MPVPYWLEFAACLLYLLPALVVVAVLLGRGGGVGGLAVWLPLAIAFDAVTCLLATRLLPFDWAWIGSRLLWVAAGAAWAYRRRRPPFTPARDWNHRTVLTLLGAGLVSALLSLSISRDYPLWDRDLHIPVVPLLRAQRLPFAHVFQAKTVFHYHFLGDAIASALQTFSGARFHAALALSLAHDLTFGLIGVSVAAWICSVTPRRLWVIPAVLAVFLMGPLSLQRAAGESQAYGFSCMSFWALSYRPHVAPSALFLVGLFAAVVQGLSDRRPGVSRTLALIVLVAALGITDEASAAIFSLALGLTWLAFPQILGRRRAHGALVLAGMAAAILGLNVAVAAALSPGGPVQAIRFLPFRLPGLQGESIPLFTRGGLRLAVLDLGPLLMLQIAVLGWALAQRNRQRLAFTTFLGCLGVVASLGLFLLDINGHPSESHRFVTSGQVLLSVAGLLVLAQSRAGDWPRGLIWSAFFFSAISAVFWSQNAIGGSYELSSTRLDCRQATGAHLGDRAQPLYVPRGDWFPIAGCRPIFTPGTDSSWQTLQTSGPALGRSAFETLNKQFVTAGQPLGVACPPNRSDPACALAQQRGTCVAAGAQYTICQVSSAARQELLSTPPGQAPNW